MGRRKKDTTIDDMRKAAIELGFGAEYVDNIIDEVNELNKIFKEINAGEIATIADIRNAKSDEKFLIITSKWNEFRLHEVATIDNYVENEHTCKFEYNGYACWYNNDDDVEIKDKGDGKWSWSIYKIKD